MRALLHYTTLHIQMSRQKHIAKILKMRFSKKHTGINWLSLLITDPLCS